MTDFLATCFAKAIRTGIVLLLVFGVTGVTAGTHLDNGYVQQRQGEMCWTYDGAVAFCAEPAR